MTRTYDPATEWVPVSSGQVPEKDGWYLLTVKYECQGASLRLRPWHDDHFIVSKKCEVIAWRYLPEPYKPEGEIDAIL